MPTFSTRCSNTLALAAANAMYVLLLLSASQPAAVDAHGYVTTPLTEFRNGVMFTKYSSTMQPAFSGKFDDSPKANVDTFTAAFNAQKTTPGGFQDLRALVKDHGSECGESNPQATPKPIPSDGVVVWQNPDTGEGFVPSHTGPCEIWLDNTRVFHDDNCAGTYTSKPKAELKVDFSTCKGSCMLRFYWLALHEPTWQIYKNCIPLAGKGGGNGNGNGNNDFVANEYSTESTESASMAPSPSPTTVNPSSTPSVAPSPSPTTVNPSPSPTPSVAPSPSPTSEYPSPSPTPSRRKCSKIKSHTRKRE